MSLGKADNRITAEPERGNQQQRRELIHLKTTFCGFFFLRGSFWGKDAEFGVFLTVDSMDRVWTFDDIPIFCLCCSLSLLGDIAVIAGEKL